MAFAISTVIAGLGLATAAVGVGVSVYNQHEAANSQAAAAQDQAQIAALQSKNVDVQKQQLALQTQQQQLQIQTNKDVINQQSQADALREQASELDATRRRRDAIRQGIVAQSTSLTRATNQGAASPGSTVVAQSQADITGQTNTNVLGINQNLQFGQQLFDINKNISSLYLNAQDANSTFVNQSQVLQNQVLDTQKTIYSLGGDASSNYASAAISSGNAAIGAGMSSLGNSISSNYSAISKLTSYFGSANIGGGLMGGGSPTGY